MKPPTKRQRVRARAILVGPVFQPIVDALDRGASGAAVASTIIDTIDAEPEKIVRMPEAVQRCGLHEDTIKAHMKRGTFPQWHRIEGTGRAKGWHSWEINGWLRARARG